MLVPGRNLEVQPEEADGTRPPSTPTCSVCSKRWLGRGRPGGRIGQILCGSSLVSLVFQWPSKGVRAHLPLLHHVAWNAQGLDWSPKAQHEGKEGVDPGVRLSC